jgi:hypothetical protein
VKRGTDHTAGNPLCWSSQSWFRWGRVNETYSLAKDGELVVTWTRRQIVAQMDEWEIAIESAVPEVLQLRGG